MMSLTKKELDFCKIFAVSRNPRESAARSGYSFPEITGIRLLGKEEVCDEIERITSKTRCSSEAADGLRRIAFGSVADAVKLISGKTDVSPEGLDLFMVSEIKSKDGAVTEIKFFDRIKALEALALAADTSKSDGSQPFIDAIFKGASAITGDMGCENDEV